MKAPPEHSQDVPLVAAIFEAAQRKCGIRFCAWCRVVMGAAPEMPENSVTHGICPACDARLRAQLDELSPAAGHAPVLPALEGAGFGAASPARLPVVFAGFKTEVHHV